MVPNVRLSQVASHDRPWFYFDPQFYVTQCIEKGMSPPLGSADSYLKAYLDRGASLGLSPNPLFDETFYLCRYPAVAREIQRGTWSSGFDHFTHAGAMEDYSPTWFFDAIFYRKNHPDLTDENLSSGGFLDRYAHYLLIGIAELRPAHWIVQALQRIKPAEHLPTSRSELCQLMTNPDRAAETLSPLLDYAWMHEKYRWDHSIRSNNFVRHYLLTVKTQALSPSPYFDEAFYVSTQPEIRAEVDGGSVSSGFEHFLERGMSEWRKPFAAFDPHYYFQTNMTGQVNPGPSRLPFFHFLLNRQARRLPISPPLAKRNILEDDGKSLYERRCALNAAQLGALSFAPPDVEPDVSIVIIACDNFAQTANCIVSLGHTTKATIEVILFDNGSTDRVRDISSINPSIKYLRAEENLGFTVAVNRAAKVARGQMLLLLNNDTELTPGAIDIALQTLQADSSIGVVGAKIVRMHGRLQEAGSIVWQDGSCHGYARDSEPLEGQTSFTRDVDFCSGCFLAMMRVDWEMMAGFDEAFAPAYYEETDFCLRMWEHGKRVVYDPRVIVWHFEFGSSSVPDEPLAQMRRNQRLFAAKHRGFLSQCLAPSPANVERARLRHVASPRILFIEDKIPNPTKGMGYVRSSAVVEALGRMCGLVSILGLHDQQWPAPTPTGGSARIEILTEVDSNTITAFLRSRIGVYDLVWLSRTHNLPRLRAWQSACPEFFNNMPVVLDTEAVAATRRFAYAQLAGQAADLTELLLEEMEPLDRVTHICAVNELDRALLHDHLAGRGIAIPVSILGHTLCTVPALPRFSDTTDIVLAGSYSELDGPNADGLLWFDREVRPLISDLPGLRFVIAGSKATRFVQAAPLQHDYRLVSDPPNMAEVYRTARVMVAPTRFAAGIPMKVHEAANHGVPVVMTDLLARQLGWHESGVMAPPPVPEQMAAAIKALACDPVSWDRTQGLQAALAAGDCDPTRFEASIRQILVAVGVFLENRDEQQVATLV